MSKKYFSLEESPYQVGFFTIKPNHDELKLLNTKGSYNIFCARLLGISYANYLRFCRDVLGASIIGKNTIYPVAYFKRNDSVTQFLRLLNARAELLFDILEKPYIDKIEKELEKMEKIRGENNEQEREQNL